MGTPLCFFVLKKQDQLLHSEFIATGWELPTSPHLVIGQPLSRALHQRTFKLFPGLFSPSLSNSEIPKWNSKKWGSKKLLVARSESSLSVVLVCLLHQVLICAMIVMLKSTVKTSSCLFCAQRYTDIPRRWWLVEDAQRHVDCYSRGI